MDRKLNLAKIASKTVKNAKINTLKTSVKIELSANTSTASPYFSPIAHRTRQHPKKEEDAIVNSAKLQSSEIKAEIDLVKKVLPRKHIKVEYDELANHTIKIEKDIKQEVEDVKPVKKGKKRTSNDQNDIKIKTETIKTEENDKPFFSEKHSKWEPKNWLQLLEKIREMRKDRNAPVDTMGCDKCFDDQADEKTKRFHHLIALMLSSQTKYATTYEAMGRLKERGLTPGEMVAMDTAQLEKLLCPVSFYKTKAKHIQKASQVLIDKFESDIPNDIAGLVSLPGVGPKMAHICMRVAWNITTGIGVDTHVHRIANRLKWVEKETKEPEQTRIALEKWLPFEQWSEVNELLVGFGQTICTPTNPKCGECLNAKICPASSIKKKSPYF